MGNQSSSSDKLARVPNELLVVIFQLSVEDHCSHDENYKRAKQLNHIYRANKRIFLLVGQIWETLYKRNISSLLPKVKHDWYLPTIYLRQLKRVRMSNPNKLLLTSIEYGYDRAFERAIELGVDIEYNKNKPIKEVCKYNRVYLCERLLQLHISLIPREVLSLAVRRGQIRLIQLFIKYRYQFDFNEYMKLAATSNQLVLVKYFVSLGADVRYRDNVALIFAAQAGNYDVVVYLVSQGSNPRARGDLPIVKAYINGHMKTVKYLQSQGADIRVAIHEKKRLDDEHYDDAMRNMQMTIIMSGSVA